MKPQYHRPGIIVAWIVWTLLLTSPAVSKLSRPELKCLSGPHYYPGAGIQFTTYVANDIGYLNPDMLRMEIIAEFDTEKSINYPAFDYICQKAGERGMQMLGLIDYMTVAWSDRSDWATEEFRERFVTRTRELVTHFSTGDYPIKSWEIWNEEDIHLPEFNVRIDPEPYALLLIDTYEAIKSIDPDATVVLGGISPKGLYYEENYLNDLYHTTAMTNYYAAHSRYPFDVVAVHPYPDYGGFTLNSLKYELDSKVMGVMEDHNDGDKTVWLTEMGWNSCLIYGSNPREKQAQYLKDSFEFVDTQIPYVTRYFWFAYEDFGTIDCWGLVEKSVRNRKPTYYAYLGLTDPGPEPPDDEVEAGEDPPIWGSSSDAFLPVQVSDSDLIEGMQPTEVLGGFHSASSGGVERLTNGVFDTDFVSVVLRDYADHEPALAVTYEFSTPMTIEEIRIFAGHFGDSGNRAFQSNDVYIDGRLIATELNTGNYGQVAPDETWPAVSVVRVLPEAPETVLATHATRVDVLMWCSSSLSLDFRDRWSPILDIDMDTDGADPAYVSPIIKEIDVLGFESPAIDETLWILY